jgi:hypothetical protein
METPESEDSRFWDSSVDDPLSCEEKAIIFRNQLFVAETHDFKIPPVEQWEHDEARDYLNSTTQEQNAIIREKYERSTELTRRVGDTRGLIRWFFQNLREHNISVSELLATYECCRYDYLPDENTFEFIATLNRIRNNQA